MSLDFRLVDGYCDKCGRDGDRVFERNITHNLNDMAAAAGIYDCLWRPDEHSMMLARDIIVPLQNGLDLLRSDRERFEKYNPKNGWGSYDGLVKFAGDLLDACVLYPDAAIKVSR